MKLVINSFITIKQKGVIVFLKAFLNFFLILYYKKFLSSTLIKKKIFNFKMLLNPFDKGISRTLILFGVRELDHKKILELAETNTKLRKIINLLGKEEKQKTNHIQILIFEDGTIEKRIVIE